MREERASSLSRRSALVKAAQFAAFAGTAMTGRALADSKAPQQTVQYQTAPNSGKKCVDCKQFRTPDTCQLVQGPISPAGWCRLFSPKDA